MPDCRNCGYRILLAKIADIHVWGEDCDKYGTDRCKKMNEKVFMGALPEPPKEVE